MKVGVTSGKKNKEAKQTKLPNSMESAIHRNIDAKNIQISYI